MTSYFKNAWASAVTQLQKPKTQMVLGMVGGFLIGVGANNMGLGIALAVALSVPGYVAGRKDNKNDEEDANKSE